jgi:hypothetical protein
MFGRVRRRVRRALTPTEAKPWERGRLVAFLGVALAACLLAVFGLGLAIYYTLNPGHHSADAAPGNGNGVDGPVTQSPRPSSTADPGTQQYAEDMLANKPMPTVDLSDAQPSAVSTRNPGMLIVPKATTTGAAGVPTGFPHTPAGALAQMAAIDQTAMQSGTLSGVRAVIAQWSSPDGPTVQSWSGVAAMADFLTSAGLSGAGSSQVAMVVTPVMGLVKGSVGPDFVVPCVDFQFDVTLNSTQHVAEADCERMVWQGSRWVIGPGAEPADPPSVWADTDTAISVGYKDLRNG